MSDWTLKPPAPGERERAEERGRRLAEEFRAQAMPFSIVSRPKETRKCARCHRPRPKSAYRFNALTVDKLDAVCRDCLARARKAARATRPAAPADDERTRVCADCGVKLPISQFYADGKGGYSHWKRCKACFRRRQNTRRNGHAG